MKVENPPRDFLAAVADIKLAILQSRARAAHASNVAPVIEGVRRELANGLKEHTAKKGRA